MFEYHYEPQYNRFHCFYTLDGYFACFYFYGGNKWLLYKADGEKPREFDSYEQVMGEATRYVRSLWSETRRPRIESHPQKVALQLQLELLKDIYT